MHASHRKDIVKIVLLIFFICIKSMLEVVLQMDRDEAD